jgi:hypothetical protein
MECFAFLQNEKLSDVLPNLVSFGFNVVYGSQLLYPVSSAFSGLAMQNVPSVRQLTCPPSAVGGLLSNVRQITHYSTAIPVSYTQGADAFSYHTVLQAVARMPSLEACTLMCETPFDQSARITIKGYLARSLESLTISELTPGALQGFLEQLVAPSLKDLFISSTMPLNALLASNVLTRSKCQLKTLALTWGSSIATSDLTGADAEAGDMEIDLTCDNLVQLLTSCPSITDIAFSCSLQKVLMTGVFTQLKTLKLKSVTLLRTMAAEDLAMLRDLKDLRPGIQVKFIDKIFFRVYNPLS